jgi:predicted amino acid racemase
MISEAGNVVSVCQTSTNTQIETVMALSEAALRAGRVHGIIIMVETDDRREGILPGQVLPFCRQVLENCPGVVISGLGTNARCISEKHPEPGSIKMLLDLKEEIERELPVKIGIISGGNSSSLGLVFNNLMPEGVNQIRIGEAILLGHETAEYKPIEGACTDAFVLEAEVIEVKKNNESVSGIIAALGIQDCGYQNIECMDPGLKTINQSSDHTVIAAADNVISEDESALNKFKTGDIITFKLNYFGILASMTSPFVKKQYLV